MPSKPYSGTYLKHLKQAQEGKVMADKAFRWGLFTLALPDVSGDPITSG